MKNKFKFILGMMLVTTSYFGFGQHTKQLNIYGGFVNGTDISRTSIGQSFDWGSNYGNISLTFGKDSSPIDFGIGLYALRSRTGENNINELLEEIGGEVFPIDGHQNFTGLSLYGAFNSDLLKFSEDGTWKLSFFLNPGINYSKYDGFQILNLTNPEMIMSFENPSVPFDLKKPAFGLETGLNFTATLTDQFRLNLRPSLIIGSKPFIKTQYDSNGDRNFENESKSISFLTGSVGLNWKFGKRETTFGRLISESIKKFNPYSQTLDLEIKNLHRGNVLKMKMTENSTSEIIKLDCILSFEKDNQALNFQLDMPKSYLSNLMPSLVEEDYAIFQANQKESLFLGDPDLYSLGFSLKNIKIDESAKTTGPGKNRIFNGKLAEVYEFESFSDPVPIIIVIGLAAIAGAIMDRYSSEEKLSAACNDEINKCRKPDGSLGEYYLYITEGWFSKECAVTCKN